MLWVHKGMNFIFGNLCEIFEALKGFFDFQDSKSLTHNVYLAGAVRVTKRYSCSGPCCPKIVLMTKVSFPCSTRISIAVLLKFKKVIRHLLRVQHGGQSFELQCQCGNMPRIVVERWRSSQGWKYSFRSAARVQQNR